MKQVVRKKIAAANNVSTVKPKYTVVIDGTNLLKIAFVSKNLNNSKGECYGAVVNFLRMLGDILRKKDFDHCHCCWDSHGSGILRWKIYPEYKANRDKNYGAMNSESDYDKAVNDFVRRVIAHSKANKKKNGSSEDEEESFERQKMIVQQILEELCIRQYDIEDVEGDDIIAYYVKNRKENEKIVIVSSDKDLTQLISENVCIWNPRAKAFVTNKNSVDVMGITHENIVLEKIFCGDSSDNIYGIKGIGETSFLKYFPEVKTTKTTVGEIISKTEKLLTERKENKQKPLKALENILNRVTDGSQGKDIYEINKAIIDLSNPLLTKEARETLDNDFYAPIDTENRKINNVYEIIKKYELSYLQNEENFGNIFSNFNRIQEAERKYQRNNQ